MNTPPIWTESDEFEPSSLSLRFSLRVKALRTRIVTSINSLRMRLAQYYVHYRVHVDHKEKCPACGTRAVHKIKFIRRFGALIHACTFCDAMWATQPLVNYPQWEVKGIDDDVQTAQPAHSPEGAGGGASREPIVIRGKA